MVSCCLLGLPQFVMRQTLADQPAGERCHLVARIQIPLVQPTRDLPGIAREVLHRDLVVRAVIAALEQGPEGFDPVRMHGSPYVFAGIVLHRFVLVSLQTLVRRMLVGVYGGSRRGVLVAFLAAEIDLVDCDRPGGRVLPLGPSLANAMGKVPGGGLADAEVALQFHARDAPEAGREQVDGHGLGAVAELGAMHQGAGLGREVLAALAAAVGLGLARALGLDVGGAAARAAHAVGPEDRRESGLGAVVVGERVHQLEQCDAHAMGSAGASLRHDPPSKPSLARSG